MKSIWGSTKGGFDSLSKDITTDVLIIGGGMCGLLCAYLLHRAGVDYVLCEAETLCGGITENTTAKITAQHGFIYARLSEKYGEDKAKKYLRANEDALKMYSSVCEGIDCDFEYGDSVVYSLDSREKAEKEFYALKKLGADAELCDTLPLPFPVEGAVKVKNQAQFHPLKFAQEISRDLNIYEHTRVEELVGTEAVTKGGRIHAKRIVIATHFPFINKHGAYFLKLYQHRSYVIALKKAPNFHGMYVDCNESGMSFRNYGEYLLVGGGGHRTGKRGGWQELREFAERYFPDSTECFHWATQDCMSLDGVPYVGRYSANTEGLYVATGFNKWGMTSSMAAASVLAEELLGKESPYRSLFSPQRSILHPQLAVNAWEAAVSLLTPTTHRCPHMGCALKWNPQERTWDCPCHGSRFSEKGKLIDNPSTGDLK